MTGFNIVCCVVNIGDSSEILKVASKYGAKDSVVSIGRGTVKNRLLTFLQINEIRKEIVTILVDANLAGEAIKDISEKMMFNKPNHGIAFSYPVSDFMGNENNEVKSMSGYKAIYVIVDKGKAEDVIDAAKKGGARGGTILNGRGAGIHEAQKLFAVEVEPEKEKVLIIAKNEIKDLIIQSIKDDMKINEPGNGIIYVIDVAEAYGLAD